MQGDTTCVSVANTGNFGLGESSGATVGGEYIPRRFIC